MNAATQHEAVPPNDWPEWCVRQRVPGGRACVWFLAPDAAAAVVIVNRLVGPMGRWGVGPEVDLEVFPRSEYLEHADAGDFTRTVIDHQVPEAWLDRQLDLLSAPRCNRRTPVA